MAEIISANSNSGKRGTRSKKLSTRVDLTPMVDLGFLLITFFIFTTTMSHATAMHLSMPDDNKIVDNPLVPESKTLNLVLKGDNKISYYYGIDSLHEQETNYSANGLRNVIQEKQKKVAAQYKSATETIILIRPTKGASYQNIVNTLDEMTINGVTRYVLMGEEKQ